MLGTVLGVGAFVAVLGLTATGAGQISHQFTVLEDTTVTVEDNGPANNVAPPDTNPAIGFPADADAIADHINGVAAAGVWWPVSLPDGTNFTGSLALSATASQTVNLLAASPGAVRAMGLTLVAGSPLSTYENDTGPARRDDRHHHGGRARHLPRAPGQPSGGVRRRHRVHGCRRLQLGAARGDRRERDADPGEHGAGRLRQPGAWHREPGRGPDGRRDQDRRRAGGGHGRSPPPSCPPTRARWS